MGRWNGVHLRLHMLFLVFAVVTLYISWLDANQLNVIGNRNVWLGIACVVILFGSVLVHELGHMMVANRLGANVADVVIGPFGGFGGSQEVFFIKLEVCSFSKSFQLSFAL